MSSPSELRDAARDAQMQHDYAEICEFRKVDWDDWELAWFLGAKFVQAEKDALEGALRKIAELRVMISHDCGFVIDATAAREIAISAIKGD